MPVKERWKEAMGDLFAQDRYEPVAPSGAWSPEIPVRAGIESRGRGAPAYTAEIDAGPISIEGSYQRRDPRDPADWRAMLRYGRKF